VCLSHHTKEKVGTQIFFATFHKESNQDVIISNSIRSIKPKQRENTIIPIMFGSIGLIRDRKDLLRQLHSERVLGHLHPAVVDCDNSISSLLAMATSKMIAMTATAAGPAVLVSAATTSAATRIQKQNE
jgi:hypothetical protein